MGRRGPAAKPTILKMITGNPGKRPLNLEEPQPEPGVPECPDWLDDEAKRCWNHTAGELIKLGVLTRIDGHALAIYCDLWSRFLVARAWIKKHGTTYPIKNSEGQVTGLGAGRK